MKSSAERSSISKEQIDKKLSETVLHLHEKSMCVPIDLSHQDEFHPNLNVNADDDESYLGYPYSMMSGPQMHLTTEESLSLSKVSFNPNPKHVKKLPFSTVTNMHKRGQP